MQVDAAPDLWRELMDESIRATDAGAPVYPQVAARPFGMLLGFPTPSRVQRPAHVPRARATRLPPDDLLAELAKPDGARRRSSPRTTSRADPTVLFDGMFQLVQGVARPALRAR